MTFTVLHIIMALLVGFSLGTMFGLGLHLLRSKPPANIPKNDQIAPPIGSVTSTQQSTLPKSSNLHTSVETTKAVALNPIVDGYDTIDSSMPSTRLNISHTITPDIENIEEDTEDHEQELSVGDTEENLATQLLDRSNPEQDDVLREFPIPNIEHSFTQTSTKSDAFDPFDEMDSESLDGDTHETDNQYEEIIDDEATFVMPKKSKPS